ncbi:HXXEE domain-containing protein [Streptomyces sp. NPDC101733]|uniref:HXXEE domain-containing protein n=1 Tax=unclassified Streptomyces TaxID=2593676 RepID=UPI0038087784
MTRHAPHRTERRALALTTSGLLAAWTVHDLEEVATTARWSRTRVPPPRARHPGLPDRMRRGVTDVDGREFATAVALTGVLVTAAAADGYRTEGRSRFFQSAVDGFGPHGFVHLARAAATRGYTPGAVSSPLVVVPFAPWARARPRRAGVLRPARVRDVAAGLALAAVATAGAYAAAGRPRRAGGASFPRRGPAR